MKTSIVNAAVRGEDVAVALKSGAYTVAGTGLCNIGSVLDTAADIGQKVVDATRAAGEACTEKGKEFLAEAAKLKGEEPAKKETKVEAPKQQFNKTWTLADFVAQHNEFANAAVAISKEFTKVSFRAEGSVKGVVTAFDAIRRADGTLCSIFADMAQKTFSVIVPPAKAEKPAKKPVKKAAAPAKETVKAETKTEEAKEENSMKAALEAARAKKAAAKAEVKSSEKAADKKAAKTAPVKEAVKKAEGKKESYSSNPKADMVLEEVVHEHGEWLDKVIRHFQGISTKPLANVAVKSNCLKFSSYGENGQDDAVSVALKSHKVKVNRKEVELDL
jgi:hypothetical protein